jgi:hypothetical protein
MEPGCGPDASAYSGCAELVRTNMRTYCAILIAMRRKSGDLLPLEAEVLRIAQDLLAQGTPEFHGWRMGQLLEDQGLGEVPFGTMYRTLNRLRDHAYLTSEWAPPEKDGLPPRRLYQITPEGIRAYATARRTPVSSRFVPRFAL